MEIKINYMFNVIILFCTSSASSISWLPEKIASTSSTCTSSICCWKFVLVSALAMLASTTGQEDVLF